MNFAHDVTAKFEQESSEIDIRTLKSNHIEPEPNFNIKPNKRYSVVFDLDNTLVYTTPLQTENTTFVIYQRKNISYKARSDTAILKSMASKITNETKVGSIEVKKKFSSPKIIKRKFYVQIRPKLIEFLQSIVQNYNIFFYTASEKEYAKEIVSKILEDAFQSQNTYLKDFEYYKSNLDNIIFSRECCTFMNGYEIKDLRILNKPLSDVILIDDIQGSGLLQPMNSLIIPPFYGNINDNFLIEELLPLLMKCSEKSDLLQNIRKYAVELSPHLVLFPELHNSDS